MFLKFLRRHRKANPIFEAIGTDMHCHLIPGVDDGSPSLEETKSCIESMQQCGFSRIFITPHFQFPRYPNTEEDITRRYEELSQQLAEAGVTMKLGGISGEYRVDSGFAARVENPRFLLLGGRYVLLEFSLHQQMMGLDEMIFDLQMKGYEVILAHPERYPYLGVFSQRMEQLKNQGVFFQLNILSMHGFYGESAKQKAFQMLDRGWVEFLGTDTHNSLYTQALIDATHSRKIQKVLETHKFMNVEL